MSEQLINPSWTRDAATKTFDGEGPHAEFFNFLRSVGGRDQYLNLGYSRTGQRHWGGKAQMRLVDRLAKPLRKLSDLDSDVDSNLIDLGCGRGGPAVRLHQKWGMNVTGIDLSDQNIEIARRRTRDLAIHEGLTFKRGDAARLPFSSKSFSFGWAIESMAYLPDKRQAIMEVKRVLRPGGVFAMAALLVDEDAVRSTTQNGHIYRDFLAAWDLYELVGSDSYEALLADAGFTVNRIEIATARTLHPHFKRLSRVLRVWKSDSLYRLTEWHIRRRTEANLHPIRDQLAVSHRAIEAGLLEYGLFWATCLSARQ